MRHSNPERFRHQVQFLRRQFLQDENVPFTNVLTEAVLAQALVAVTGWVLATHHHQSLWELTPRPEPAPGTSVAVAPKLTANW
jgi:hypothetical protein